MRISSYSIQIILAVSTATVLSTIPTNAFSPSFTNIKSTPTFTSTSKLSAGHPGAETLQKAPPTGFIDTELRGAAMKLHTRAQAPKEGEKEESKESQERRKSYVTTMDDYLQFLVDSQHVYRTFEDIIQREEMHPELKPFVDTGLERTNPLEQDIQFILSTYYKDGEKEVKVGKMGTEYALTLESIAQKGKEGIPELMCHYYNHYFAHTAGGRMIGKKMASLLLEKKTLEFYKWEGDINQIKTSVKDSIEEMAEGWSRKERDECVNGTEAAFRGGGALNSYLGGASPH